MYIENYKMSDFKWSELEKKVAHRVFDAALKVELAEVMAQFKAKAMAAKEPDDMWSVAAFLRTRRREIDSKYDYRYSQLPMLFGILLYQGRIQQAQLTGLSEEKLACIRHVAAHGKQN